MPKKSTFSDEQYEMIWEAAKRIRPKYKNQTQMALALGLTQQSIANLLIGKYKPSIHYATEIALADGRMLHDLVGDPVEGTSYYDFVHSGTRFKNLEKCLDFYEDQKKWNPWTVAAAKAGFFGDEDPSPALWAGKLSALETILEKARSKTR